MFSHAIFNQTLAKEKSLPPPPLVEEDAKPYVYVPLALINSTNHSSLNSSHVQNHNTTINQGKCGFNPIERFSIKCRKTQTKIITTANQGEENYR